MSLWLSNVMVAICSSEGEDLPRHAHLGAGVHAAGVVAERELHGVARLLASVVPERVEDVLRRGGGSRFGMMVSEWLCG